MGDPTPKNSSNNLETTPEDVASVPVADIEAYRAAGGKVSVSAIQRHFKTGYGAASLIASYLRDTQPAEEASVEPELESAPVVEVESDVEEVENQIPEKSPENINGVYLTEIEMYRNDGGKDDLSTIRKYFSVGPGAAMNILQYLRSTQPKEESVEPESDIDIPGLMDKALGNIKNQSEKKATMAKAAAAEPASNQFRINKEELPEIDEKQKVRDEAIANLRQTKENAERNLEASLAKKQENDKLVATLRRELAEIRERKEKSETDSLEISSATNETIERYKQKIKEIESELKTVDDMLATKKKALEQTGKLRFIKREDLQTEISGLIESKEFTGKNLIDWQNMLKDEEQREIKRLERKEAERKEKEKKEAEKQEKVLALEKDKEANPFKYFIIKNMHDSAFWCLYMRDKEKATLEDINSVCEESGKDIKFWTSSLITQNRFNTVEFSSNGFSLQLQNVEEVKNEQGIGTQDSRAKYRLVTPYWIYDQNEGALSYEDGLRLLYERSGEYQKEQLALFESQNKGK